MNTPTWDQVFMTMSYLMATKSGDYSTHVGSIIVAPDNTLRSIGYNDLPRGIGEGEDNEMGVPCNRSHVDGIKLAITEHAERNAIYNAGRNAVSLIGCRLYVTWIPCLDCARGIIQAGIKKVIVHKQGQEAFLKARNYEESVWTKSHDLFERYMTEAGIEIVWFDKPLVPIEGFFSGTPVLFDMMELN